MSDVVVVGAGLAGLAAARWLVAHGHEATVVEARERVGGRTQTQVLDDGTPLELGGQWFGEGHTRMYELAAELVTSLAVKATRGHRIVGAARARVDGTILHIGRLTVAPDAQGHGIGSRLLAELERLAPATIETFTLFTGHLSTANIRLYQRLGYTETRREQLNPGVVLVHLDKPARARRRLAG